MAVYVAYGPPMAAATGAGRSPPCRTRRTISCRLRGVVWAATSFAVGARVGRDERLGSPSAIQLCRGVPDDARPRDLPALFVGDPGLTIGETWATTGEWLIAGIDELDEGCAARLIVRLSWPFTPEAETALLFAKL